MIDRKRELNVNENNDLIEYIKDWLLEGPPWVRYRTRLDILGQSKDDPVVINEYNELVNHPLIIRLLQEIQEWPGKVLKRHNDANLLIHKLTFLADMGLTLELKEIRNVSEKILKIQDKEGPFYSLINIPTHFGGTGKDEYSWMLCDAPLVTYSLIKFGYAEDEKVKQSVEHLVSLVRENGWPCAAYSNLGSKFRGPGRKDMPCPYANLLMLKLLSSLKKNRYYNETKIGIETSLSLWERRKEIKPFLFAMGTDFKKLKAPLIWYDILHFTDVLSHYQSVKSDQRFHEIIDILPALADENGFYKAGSVWRAWKDWDFGQKKEPSRYITFMVYRVLKRVKLNVG
jgi:hypothetical protein